jgi:hypothetical protein
MNVAPDLVEQVMYVCKYVSCVYFTSKTSTVDRALVLLLGQPLPESNFSRTWGEEANWTIMDDFP